MFDIETWHARRITGGVGNAESHLEPAYNKTTITWTMIYVAVYLRVCLDCLHFLKPVWIYSV